MQLPYVMISGSWRRGNREDSPATVREADGPRPCKTASSIRRWWTHALLVSERWGLRIILAANHSEFPFSWLRNRQVHLGRESIVFTMISSGINLFWDLGVVNPVQEIFDSNQKICRFLGSNFSSVRRSPTMRPQQDFSRSFCSCCTPPLLSCSFLVPLGLLSHYLFTSLVVFLCFLFPPLVRIALLPVVICVYHVEVSWSYMPGGDHSSPGRVRKPVGPLGPPSPSGVLPTPASCVGQLLGVPGEPVHLA